MNKDSEFESVWTGVADELRRVRRRRRAWQTSTLGVLLLAGVFWMNQMLAPGPGPLPELAESPASNSEIESALRPVGLAVLVYDGSGMRFEMMDGEQLAERPMELSLQPVVMNSTGSWW